MNPQISASQPIRVSASAATPSAELGGGHSYAFDRASGMFVAKAPTPPVKSPPAGIASILRPAARERWMMPLAATMTPSRIEWILRTALTSESPAAEQGLYDLMEATWPRLLKNRMEVTDAVVALDWQIMDAADGENLPGAKELVERTKNGMCGDPVEDGQGWRGTMESLMSAWFRGISISEVDWEYRPGRQKTEEKSASASSSGLASSVSKSSVSLPAAWLPRQTRDVDARFFGWKSSGRLMLYPDAQPENAVDFPPHKFIIGIRKAGKGHPSGTALLRALAWWWCAANFSTEWLLNFAQIFGQPFRWATYDAGQDGVKAELSDMMEQMGSAAWGIGPAGTEIEWHESSKSGADNPQAHMIDRADTACDLLVLGQTLTGSVSKEGGSRALGDVHSAVRSDIIDSAALWLAEILNEQLIPAIAAVNYGPVTEDSSLPWFQPARKSKKDTKVVAETFEIVLRSGIPLLKEEVYDALDMSQPKPGEEAFEGNTGAIPAAVPPDMRRMLAKLPLDAREYFLARLNS